MTCLIHAESPTITDVSSYGSPPAYVRRSGANSIELERTVTSQGPVRFLPPSALSGAYHARHDGPFPFDPNVALGSDLITYETARRYWACFWAGSREVDSLVKGQQRGTSQPAVSDQRAREAFWRSIGAVPRLIESRWRYFGTPFGSQATLELCGKLDHLHDIFGQAGPRFHELSRLAEHLHHTLKLYESLHLPASRETRLIPPETWVFPV